jgi:hypothetical protein
MNPPTRQQLAEMLMTSNDSFDLGTRRRNHGLQPEWRVPQFGTNPNRLPGKPNLQVAC